MEIRRCRIQEFETLRGFFARYRSESGRDSLSCEKISRLRHETLEHPFSRGEGTSWLVWEEGRPVAHLKATPCPVYYRGERRESTWWQGFHAIPGARETTAGNAAALLALKVSTMPHGHALLGTPGADSRVFKLYQRMKFHYWGMVPFFYYIVDGSRALRHLSVFRQKPVLSRVAAVLSRLCIPGKLLALRHWRRRDLVGKFHVEAWQSFPAEADQLWESVVARYSLIFDRSSQYLNWRYADPAYLRVGVFHDQQLVGWVVCKATQMHDNFYFGNLKVGTIVDVLVDPTSAKDVQAVLSVGLRSLLESGADLVITNLSEGRMMRKVQRLGFLAGPSNFHFFTHNLPTLRLDECHLTRGDSDGDDRL